MQIFSQVLSWQIPKFHIKHGLFAMFINMAQDFYLHKNKSFTYMKICLKVTIETLKLPHVTPIYFAHFFYLDKIKAFKAF